MLNIENKIESLKKYFSEQPNVLGAWIIGLYGTEYQREDSVLRHPLSFNSKA